MVPKEPPAMKDAESAACTRGANRLSTNAMPTLPYAASPTPTTNRAARSCS